MKTTPKADLRRLSALAFHRGDWGRELLRRIHRLRRKAKTHPDLPLLESLHPWLLSPLTLWPIQLEDLGRYAAEMVEAGKGLDPQIRLLLSFLNGPPGETTQAVTSQHERVIQLGDYGSLIHAQHKFNNAEERLAHDPEFQKDWQQVKSAFEVTQFRGRKGIIRHRMLPGRNYRTDWRFMPRWTKRRLRTTIAAMSDDLFPSGPWTGFYNYSPRDKHRMDLHLTFAAGRLTGDGSDDVGRFTIHGSYDAAAMECAWTKNYPGSHNVAYRGFREGKGIWGTWEINAWCRGGFHIWPLGEGAGEANSAGQSAVVPEEITTLQPVEN